MEDLQGIGDNLSDAEAIEAYFFREFGRVVHTNGHRLEDVARAAHVRQTVLVKAVAGYNGFPPSTFVKNVLRACHLSPSESNRIFRIWEVAAEVRKSLRSFDKESVNTASMARDDNFNDKLVQNWFTELKAPPLQQKLREDVEGYGGLKPNPLTATNKEEFLKCMRDFHVWATEPSLREIARRSKAVAFSTLSTALNPNKPLRMPTMKVVAAFIVGCGGSEDDLVQWTTAWRRIRMDKTRETATSTHENVTSLPTNRRTAS